MLAHIWSLPHQIEWVLLGVSKNDRTINKLMGEMNKKNSEDKLFKGKPRTQTLKLQWYSLEETMRATRRKFLKKKFLIGITNDINYRLNSSFFFPS